MTQAQYDHHFYADLDRTAAPSARRIVPLINALWPVGNVIDIGCGDGSWLCEFKHQGAGRIWGVDGDWVDKKSLKISDDCFTHAAIDQGLDLTGTYDLSMSLEVAEHLPPERAESFVAQLCALAPVVLFSAAIPHQGGVGHVNEQWPDYWAALFQTNGYHTVDFLREQVWSDEDVTWWYSQNIVLYASDEALEKSSALAAARERSPDVPPRLVHPEMYMDVVRRSTPSFGRSLQYAGAALKRSLNKRLRPKSS